MLGSENFISSKCFKSRHFSFPMERLTQLLSHSTKEVILMAKLSKEERKALIEKATQERAKHPQVKKGSGFAELDKEAAKLTAEN